MLAPILVALALVLPQHAEAAKPPVHIARSTSYCLRGTMSDGSFTRDRSVAMNTLPLGSKIKLVGRRFMGKRVFIVRDHIGYGSELDFWAPSCAISRQWGRRTVKYRVLRSGR